MGSLLVELVPFAVGLAITPTAVATVILLLSSRRPVANTLAFASPFVLVYAVVAVIVLVAAGAATGPLLTEREKHAASLAVGLVLLALGVGSVVRRRSAQAHHAAKPGMLARIDSAAPPAAFGIGFGLALLNPNMPILLGGLAAVAAAEVSQGGRVVGAAFLVVWSEVGLVGPLLWFVLDRERATRGLKRLKDWLGRHEHAVDLAVLFGFGTVFTLKGLAGL